MREVGRGRWRGEDGGLAGTQALGWVGLEGCEGVGAGAGGCGGGGGGLELVAVGLCFYFILVFEEGLTEIENLAIVAVIPYIFLMGLCVNMLNKSKKYSAIVFVRCSADTTYFMMTIRFWKKLN